MPKATLTFDLPDEQTEHEMANKAADMWCVLNNLDQELRSHIKYDSHPEWHGETVEDIRKILLDMMMERGINFN